MLKQMCIYHVNILFLITSNELWFNSYLGFIKYYLLGETGHCFNSQIYIFQLNKFNFYMTLVGLKGYMETCFIVL